MRKYLVLITLVLTAGFAYALQINPAGRPLINTIRVEGAIDPAVARYVERGIESAEENNAQALVILLETPGGLDDSMRKIVQSILASRVPVVVYVSPQGARAASAGAIITLAAHVAAMSPSTAIGAAHPVNIGGGETDDVMMEKVENDAAAYSKDLARKRGRNVQWAEAVVRQSISSTSKEALDKNVIDLIADDLQDLLRQIDGRQVTTNTGKVTIRTTDADIQEIPQTIGERFLHLVANPNLAYIFMMIAVYGIIFELSNPGSVFPGVIGGISLILALFSFAILPINLTGILLVGLGIILLIIDLFTPSEGILTVGGLAAFVIGSLILFDTPQSPAFRVSLLLVISTAILTGGFFLYAMHAGIRAQKSRVVTGVEGMVGQIAEAKTDIDPYGKVFTEGEWWNAEAEGEPVRKGEFVRIVRVEKLKVIVRKET
ncbi:MAG: NfeD family protein [Armatimonadota bacterium]